MPRGRSVRQEAQEPAPESNLTEAVVNGPASSFDEPKDARPTNVEAILNGEEDGDSGAGDGSSEQYVKYVGRASQRAIDAGTWPPGVDQDLSAVWSFSNNFKIPASAFSESQLGYLLGDSENGFKLVDGVRP